MAEFPYCRSTPNDGVNICDCNDPYITVTLQNAGKSIIIEGLVDSGCTITLVNASLAKKLGVNLDMLIVPAKVYGATGETTGQMMDLDIFVNAMGRKYKSPIIFVKDLPVSALLGQKNLFENFDIHFQKTRHRFLMDEAGRG